MDKKNKSFTYKFVLVCCYICLMCGITAITSLIICGTTALLNFLF